MLKELNDVLSIVTKVVNLISARALHKCQFSLLLNEVESAYNGLLMYVGLAEEKFLNDLSNA